MELFVGYLNIKYNSHLSPNKHEKIRIIIIHYHNLTQKIQIEPKVQFKVVILLYTYFFYTF